MIAVLADLLREAARSAQGGDEERAVATLTRARDEESSLCDLRAAAEEGLAIVASTPFRRRSDQDVRLMADLVVPLDRALTNARVLVRRSVQLARSGRRLPPKYADLVEQLADAVLEIESELRIARTPIVARGSLVAVGEATPGCPAVPTCRSR